MKQSDASQGQPTGSAPISGTRQCEIHGEDQVQRDARRHAHKRQQERRNVSQRAVAIGVEDALYRTRIRVRMEETVIHSRGAPEQVETDRDDDEGGVVDERGGPLTVVAKYPRRAPSGTARP